jgi:hypothetical protein
MANNPEKRIYSLNVAAWLLSKGIRYTELKIDEETQNCYFIFPESKEVGKQINLFRKNKELTDFLVNYKYLKKKMANVLIENTQQHDKRMDEIRGEFWDYKEKKQLSQYLLEDEPSYTQSIEVNKSKNGTPIYNAIMKLKQQIYGDIQQSGENVDDYHLVMTHRPTDDENIVIEIIKAFKKLK